MNWLIALITTLLALIAGYFSNPFETVICCLLLGMAMDLKDIKDFIIKKK